MNSRQHITMLLDNSFESDARVEKECESLYKRGYSITLYATNENHDLKEIEERTNVKIVRLFDHIIHQPLNRTYKNRINQYAVEIANTKPSIIHCHDYKTLIIGKRIKEINPSSILIYDSHEFLAGWPWFKEIKTLKGKIKGRFVWNKFKQLEREAIPFVNAIITVSETLAEEILKEFELKNQPKVIRNIPDEIIIEPNNYLKQFYKLNNNSTIIIHSGNVYHSENRIKSLIKVFSHLQKNDYHLVFIADSIKIKTMAKSINNINIHFHPYPKRKELYKIIQSADFGLVYTWQPKWKSHWFSLPNRILEYTLAQLPIISTNQPEFKKLSDKFGHIVLFNGKNEKELYDAIIKGRNEKIALKKQAVKASNQLSWENEIESLIEIYKEYSNEK